MLIRTPPKKQDGIILIIALIMMVAMTLGGLALMRSVHTTTIIAGNLAFQQAATNSADRGIEAAVTWLETTKAANINGLDGDIAAQGYSAAKTTTDDPSGNQDWTELWTAVWMPEGVRTVGDDAAGNSVQYVIQRMCNSTGPSSTAGCATSPVDVTSSGGSRGAGSQNISVNSQVYYRITVRVAGPRNTSSFVQSIVAL
jgi:Tfp pilus assembly protein PilX